jgi:hypothetical protein
LSVQGSNIGVDTEGHTEILRDKVLSGFPCPVSDIRLYVSLRLRIDASYLELKRKMVVSRLRPPALH